MTLASVQLTASSHDRLDGGLVPVQDRVKDSARRALRVLGMSPVTSFVSLPTLPDRPHRQVVRCVAAGTRAREDVAVKVLLDPSPAATAAFGWEHRLAYGMGATADALICAGVLDRNPVVSVLHPHPIALGDAVAAVTRFVTSLRQPLTAGVWGTTLGMLHRIGSTDSALAMLSTHPRTNALFGLTADGLLAALDRPDHPLRGERDLVLRYVHAVREQALRAVELDPQPLLIHRDFHALNCINAPGGAVAIDWQDGGWGNRSDDFAWLYLAVSRFRRPVSLLTTAKAAYTATSGGACPTDAQIRASGHLLELLCLGFSIQNAYRSRAHAQECRTELPILRGPHTRTSRWRMLHNPALFAPGVVA